MVHDRLERIGMFLPDKQRKMIVDFLANIREDMPEEHTPLDGDTVHARIMSYPTKIPTDCKIEAHDIYVDIQFTLTGGEGIDIFPREESQELTADDEKDFYTFSNDHPPQLSIANLPGWFTMIFPHEAHRPQESLDGACRIVKKGVIKIKASCFE